MANCELRCTQIYLTFICISTGISTNVSSVIALTDADEPYSPGGSSDDDLPLLPVKLPATSSQMQSAEDELKRKMEEINRQIAAQEMEIAGLLTGESAVIIKI